MVCGRNTFTTNVPERSRTADQSARSDRSSFGSLAADRTSAALPCTDDVSTLLVVYPDRYQS